MIYYGKKKNETSSNLISGIEIGTSTISCFVGDFDEEKKTSAILGFGQNKNLGMDRNRITDIKKFKNSIQSAIKKAEDESGTKIEEAFITSSLLKPKTKLVNVLSEITFGKKVSNYDLNHAFRKIDLSSFENDENKILHIIPVEYRLDGNEIKGSPIGLYGSQLQIKYNIVYTNRFALQNINNLIKGCMIDVKAITTSAYSSGLACMESINHSVGNYIVLDIGASNVSIAMFSKDLLLHLVQLPLGSEYITIDIAKVLNTDKKEAERIKNLYGSVEISENDFTNNVNITSLTDTNQKEISTVSKGDICNIIRPRVEEIFNYVRTYLESRHALAPISKILMTGGGANLNGMKDLAEEILGKPVSKIAYNKFSTPIEELSDPMFASLFGLIEYKSIHEYELEKKESLKSKILAKVKKWIDDNF
ncbi:MAG: cell division protein FtsA [Alphaproteobacteria bacterium]|jgi:cell division protein FtsA|nr:cell division protein FtsA [Alphaproteobacteria bacterium]